MAPWIRVATSSNLCRPIGIGAFKVFQVLRRLVNKFYDPFLSFNPLPLGAVLLGTSMALFAREAEPLVLRLAALMIPTLMVWGAKDKIVPVSNAYSAARLHPSCKLHVFENGGHFAYSREARRFAAILADFLH